jgi:hypothetical protein
MLTEVSVLFSRHMDAWCTCTGVHRGMAQVSDNKEHAQVESANQSVKWCMIVCQQSRGTQTQRVDGALFCKWACWEMTELSE